MTVTDLNALAEAVEAQVSKGQRQLLDMARAAAQEANIGRCRVTLHDAPDILSNALDTLRGAQQAEQRASEALDQARLEAEWSLSSCFETRANKTWLVRSADSAPLAEEDQRTMTAAEKKEWVAYHAGQSEGVATATKALRYAEAEVAGARDAVTLAERRFTAARVDLEAATQYLAALTYALPDRERRGQ